MKRELVICDIDNTLVRGQSQQLLLRYLFRIHYISLWYFLKITPWFLLYKLGIIQSPQSVMEHAYSFLEGKDVASFNAIVKNYITKEASDIFYKEAFPLLEEHRRLGREIILLSNSPDVLAKNMADALGVSHTISTELEVKNGAFTGKVLGDIVYGENKTHNIEEYLQSAGKTFEDMWVYGDHISDLPILEKGTHSIVVNPDAPLRREAEKRHWEILNFR